MASNVTVTSDDVPPGTYEVVAWHPRCPETRQPVTVTAEQQTSVSFTLEQSVSRMLAERRQREKRGVTRGLGSKREQLNLPVVTESHPACCPERDGER